MKKSTIITIILISIFLFFIIIGIACVGIIKSFNKPEIKTNKDTIYEIFTNFPECNNIYFTTKILHRGGVGPSIYEIHILAELTDESYNEFINKVNYDQTKDTETLINPNRINYNWKNVENYNIIEAKNFEIASVQSIYVDEDTKTIYVIADGGN